MRLEFIGCATCECSFQQLIIDAVMVRFFTLHWIDIGLMPLMSCLKDFKNDIYSFFARCSAHKGSVKMFEIPSSLCGKQVAGSSILAFTVALTKVKRQIVNSYYEQKKK